MARRVPREWLQFTYLDPRKILVGLSEIAETYPLNELTYHSRSLRTHALRSFGEGRQAALFCFGIGQALGIDVRFALVERQDFDFIARFEVDGEGQYVPVQLKEWVPAHLPNPQPLQVELDKLAKYADSEDLVVAFHLNRDERVVLSELTFPRTIKELWFFGASERSQTHWVLMGNLLTEQARVYEFAYPEA